MEQGIENARLTSAGRWLPTALVLTAITALAAALRLLYLGGGANDPMYDASVLSMGMSWHNFLFAAFDPGGIVAIDKPPLDIWLQVASVKLFGFNSFALKFPEALGGTLAVPLLFDTVRRKFSSPAGLASALALAVLPIAVLTARSDTMDSIMMLMLVLAAWCVVRGGQSGRIGWLIGASVAAGIAFNVKLLETFVALPGLLALLWFSIPRDRRARVRIVALCALTYVVVSLSWLTFVSLWPSQPKPFPMGSTHASYWETAFVFNGVGRLRQSATRVSTGTQSSPQLANQHVPPPSAVRLLKATGPISGRELGFEIFGGLLFGGLASGFALARWRRLRAKGEAVNRLTVGASIGLAVWLLSGIIVYSTLKRLPVRYVEAFTPAVAAAFGVGFTYLAQSARQSRVVLGALTAAVPVAAGYLVYIFASGLTSLWIGICAAIAGTLVIVVAWSTPRMRIEVRRVLATTGAGLAFVGLLLPSISVSVSIVNNRKTDSIAQELIKPHEVDKLSRIFKLYSATTRYEFAVDKALRASSFIVKDRRPVLPMTAVSTTVVTSGSALAMAVKLKEVRYALVGGPCKPGTADTSRCSEPSLWVRDHGKDVSKQFGIRSPNVLYDLSPAQTAGGG